MVGRAAADEHRPMARVLWLAFPYLSLMTLCRCAPVTRLVGGHPRLTLPLGWLALLVLFAAVLGLYTISLPVAMLCGAVSGLSMLTPRSGGDDDGGGGDDGPSDDPPPGIDWDAFDAARRAWARGPRDPAGVA